MMKAISLPSASALQLLLVLVASIHSLANGAEPTRIKLDVDLSEIDRNLATAKLKIPVQPGELSLWYPKWLPGCHAPAGPIQNLAHFEITTDQGTTLPWRRRTPEPYEFLIDIPAGVSHIDVGIQYIVNQATTNSEGADCAFEGNVGYFSFNTVAVYPTSSEQKYGTGYDLIYEVRLTLPPDIKAQGPLPLKVQPLEANSDRIREYEPVPLHQLVDSPLMLGEFINTIELTAADSPYKPHFLHVASSEEEQTELPEEFVSGLKALVGEAAEVFGHAPFDEYHFLIIIDDTLSDIGLEHGNSSLNTMSIDEIEDEGLRADWPAELLPHEYVHAWCGKYRIPRAMAQLDFHSDKDFRLLWVYEGLTEYYGTVLAARSGLVTKQQFLDHKAQRIHELSLQSGRNWRSLEDTATMSHLLRDFSAYWQYRRRDQDYYDEGALYWWEADALIRSETAGQKSLDTFAATFFGDQVKDEESKPEFIPYREVDVYRALNQVHNHTWESFFEKRIKATQKSLNMRAIARSNYRLKYGPTPNAYQSRLESQYAYCDESACLGMTLSHDGVVNGIIPTGPADQAKLAEGDSITKFNTADFDHAALRQWLDASNEGDLLLLTVDRHGKELKFEITIGNPHARFPYLENADSRDLIQEIILPKVEMLVP